MAHMPSGLPPPSTLGQAPRLLAAQRLLDAHGWCSVGKGGRNGERAKREKDSGRKEV
jgi:hypothetical protein